MMPHRARNAIVPRRKVLCAAAPRSGMLARFNVFIVRIDKGQQVDAAFGCCVTRGAATADVPCEGEENDECDDDAGDESTDGAAM